MQKAEPDGSAFNSNLDLPYELRLQDFDMAMRDIYDYFYDMNKYLVGKGLPRLDDMLRPATLSGLLSDMIASSMAKHSRVLTENKFHNGHPDLILKGRYPSDKIKSGECGVEVKSTKKKGGAVDTHGARDQWLCTFVYETDNLSEPVQSRSPLRFTEVYLGHVKRSDFRRNERTELGTRTATLDRAGLARYRDRWVYKVERVRSSTHIVVPV